MVVYRELFHNVFYTMNYYAEGFKKYAEFSGRANRAEYWIFFLVNALITFFLIFLIPIIGLRPIWMIIALFCLGTFIPSLSVFVRRLHDTDRSGWWYFISFVPLVGGIVLLVFTLLPGTPGTNRFGAPTEASASIPPSSPASVLPPDLSTTPENPPTPPVAS